MKRFFVTLLCLSLAPAFLFSAEPDERRANTVVLDAAGVENLRIQTTAAAPAEFETTVFALGRIEVYPGRRAVISSRVPGRAVDVFIKHDHPVTKGDKALTLESRQFGDPPPTITLTAPISGLVSAVNVVPGEPVSPDKVLAEILDLSEVYALARVPEHLAGRLKPGQRAHIVATALPEESYSATLEHFGATADPASGTIEAAFHVTNPEDRLRPGMRVEFSIVTEKRSGVVSVPRIAVQGDLANRFVYVKDTELAHAFVKTPVVVGQSNDRHVEIVRGLSPGDQVVTQGAYSLAFAGGGSLSLKEALDAAHGHQHNPVGSEITAEKTSKAGASSPEEDHDHDHDEEHEHDHDEVLWMVVSGVLFVLLLIVSARYRKLSANASAPSIQPPSA